MNDQELLGSLSKTFKVEGKQGYQRLREALNLTDADMDALAQLTNHAGHHVLLRIAESRAQLVLDKLKYLENGSTEIESSVRLWQALSQAADDLRWFPKMAREALDNKDRASLEELLNPTNEDEVQL